MSNPAAVLFALSMVVWVADARFTPHTTRSHEPNVTCESGPSATPPADADAEVVVCGSRK